MYSSCAVPNVQSNKQNGDDLWLLMETNGIGKRDSVLSKIGGRTGLVARASDSGSGDPGSILGRVGVLFP